MERLGADHLDDVFLILPPHATDPNGRRLNTLTLGDPPVSLRVYYNKVESVIRGDLVRIGYPNAAPHATQSWTQHAREFETICRMSPGERAKLADALWAEIVAMETIEGDPDAVREIRPFEYLLSHFAGSAPGEPGGAVLQGLAYAYYRADSPNVTLRVFKSGAGSARVGAAGDVDGWAGESLALSVEVKDLDLGPADEIQLAQFHKAFAKWPNATFVVLARSFSQEIREWMARRNILALDRPRMASNVAYWDLPKQQLAVREFSYFVSVIQGSPRMIRRFRDFMGDAGLKIS